MSKKKLSFLLTIAISISIAFTGCSLSKDDVNTSIADNQNGQSFESIENVPKFHDDPFVVINDNKPKFNKKYFSRKSYERYSRLDSLGRCGPAIANIGRDLMPTEKRGRIGMVKPSGWQISKYDFVDGKYLYNRCHLIGYQLSGENANDRNLITGTRYMNVDGMLPFENKVAHYVKSTGKHVLYRVTPIYRGSNLVADGVHMEAVSVEDRGKGICFNVFVYNNQPGVKINYKNGNNRANGDSAEVQAEKERRAKSRSNANKYPKDNRVRRYVLNTNTKKFHKHSCSSVERTSPKNRKVVKARRSELIDEGYSPCGQCHP